MYADDYCESILRALDNQ